MELELAAMRDIAGTIKKLPTEMRQRVANWVSAQPWLDEEVPPPGGSEATGVAVGG